MSLFLWLKGFPACLFTQLAKLTHHPKRKLVDMKCPTCALGTHGGIWRLLTLPPGHYTGTCGHDFDKIDYQRPTK